MGHSACPIRSEALDLARRPAVPVALLFMLGIVLYPHLPQRIDLWLVSGLALTIGALTMFHRPCLCSALLAAAVMVAGVGAGQVERFHYPRDHISLFATDVRRLAQVELYIDDPPRLLTGAFGHFRALPPKQALTARVLRLKSWDGWIDAQGEVLVQIAQPHPRLAAGQTLRAIGLLERPAPAMNPGQFDWAGYYREQRVLVSLQISQAKNIQILSESDPGWIARLRQRARQALARGFQADQSLDHALLCALVLGDRDPELRDVQEQFRRTGTSHHLAISGMHVAILGGVVYWLCRALRIRPRSAALVGMAFVILYGCTAMPRPPVVRAVLLCLAFGVGITSRRSVDALQLLAMTVLAMLLWQPMDLFNSGFQLSFLTVLGLIVLTPYVQSMLTTQADRDRLIAAGAGPVDSLTAASMWADHKLLQLLVAAIVAWLVSFPLVARHFEQLNPWGVAGSILMAPFVFMALVGGMLKIVLTLLWPGFADVWAQLAAYPVQWIRGFVALLAKLPWAEVPLPAPALWLMTLYYVALAGALRSWPAPGTRWMLRGGAATCFLAIVFLPYHSATPIRPATDELRITLLAVGAGQCAVVEPPSGRVLLIDAGSASLSDLLRKCLAPFLRHYGRTSIDTILISHANYDHFSAVAEIVAAYDVREVMVSTHFRPHSIDNYPAEAMLRTLDQLERPPRIIAPGVEIPLGRETSMQILWPPPEFDASANEASLVVRLTHAGRTILLPGDVQEVALRRLLENPEDLRADILIAPHHGSAEDSTGRFLRAVNPSLILSSNDRTLTMKQRNFETIAAPTPMYRTHRHGAITIRIDRAGNIAVEPFLPDDE